MNLLKEPRILCSLNFINIIWLNYTFKYNIIYIKLKVASKLPGSRIHSKWAKNCSMS